MDMSGYSTQNLIDAVDMDAYAVRKEAEYRAAKAEKAAKKAKAAYEKAMKEIELCGKAINASYAA